MAPSLARSTATLVRWLGPWGASKTPSRVVRHKYTLHGKQTFRTYEFRPTDQPPWGVYVITPGMHFLGADDPRLDRFCRVLATCGLIVVAPLLPDLLDIRLRADTDADLRAAWVHALRIARSYHLPNPALFSISFGSLPAIRLAADPEHRDEVSSLVLFGGYGDFDRAVTHLLSGAHEGPDGLIQGVNDPLNAAAIFRNVLHLLPIPQKHHAELDRAWMSIIHRTWGHVSSFKGKESYPLVAHEIAATLSEPIREWFLLGCNLRPNALDAVRQALSGGAFAFANPQPSLAHVRASVTIVHGRDDDVIPWTEAARIRDALPASTPSEVLLTGMYGHTGSVLPSPRALANEVATMLSIARALMKAPRAPNAE
ncbi:MAG: hypothetical protein U0165_10370 [Polyangiaceae bacterium]